MIVRELTGGIHILVNLEELSLSKIMEREKECQHS